MRRIPLITLAAVIAFCSAGVASASIYPYWSGSGYWDQTTGRVWQPLNDSLVGGDNFTSWDTFAGMFNPVTGRELGCKGHSCLFWASSGQVAQVFDHIDGLPQGTPVSGPQLGPIFGAFGSTLIADYNCPDAPDYSPPGFADYYSGAFTRDKYLIVNSLSTSPCDQPTDGSSWAGSATDRSDPSYAAYLYEQISTPVSMPEPGTSVLLVSGILTLILGLRRRRQCSYPSSPIRKI